MQHSTFKPKPSTPKANSFSRLKLLRQRSSMTDQFECVPNNHFRTDPTRRDRIPPSVGFHTVLQIRSEYSGATIHRDAPIIGESQSPVSSCHKILLTNIFACSVFWILSLEHQASARFYWEKQGPTGPYGLLHFLNDLVQQPIKFMARQRL